MSCFILFRGTSLYGSVDRMLDELAAAFRADGDQAVIVDTTAVQRFPSAPVRQVLTDWVADLKRAERDRSYTVATVVVLSSGPLRALTAAINLIRRPVSPQHWTATLAEGFDRAGVGSHSRDFGVIDTSEDEPQSGSGG